MHRSRTDHRGESEETMHRTLRALRHPQTLLGGVLMTARVRDCRGGIAGRMQPGPLPRARRGAIGRLYDPRSALAGDDYQDGRFAELSLP